MIINCIIVEDEPLAAERLKDFIKKIQSLNFLASFENGLDALSYLKNNKVDLVFLDIKIGKLSGIQLLEQTLIDAQIIFCTAYQEYAIKSYELNVTDYLLKPFTFERFLQSIEKAKYNIEKKSGVVKKSIFVKSGNHLEQIALDDILYIEGMGDYRSIFCVNKRVMTLQTFYDLEKEIPEAIICRVHKSYMVSINKINTIERDQVKIGNKIIPISETYKKTFLSLLKNK